MEETQKQIAVTMEFIDLLTKKIVDQINKNDWKDLDSLFDERLKMLNSLIKLFESENSDRKVLTDYLLEFQKRDELIGMNVAKELEMVRNSLLNINNVKKYINI